MKISRYKTNNLPTSIGTRMLLIGLLLISLVACDEQPPETINKELDLNLPNIGSGQLSFASEEETQEQEDSTLAETAIVTVDTGSPSLEQDNPLNLINTKNINNRLFAQSNASTPLMQDEFYLLGWSADGEKIAYAIEEETDAAALFSAGVYIQDLVSDKIIWGIKEQAELNELNGIDEYWNKNKQKIIKELEQYDITFDENASLKKPPIHYNGDQFTYSVRTSKVRGRAEIKAYRILLNSKAKGNKEISKVTLKPRGNQMGSKQKVAVIGYFQGSDKARVATLVGLLESGFEGARIVRYKIIGASLKYGKWYK